MRAQHVHVHFAVFFSITGDGAGDVEILWPPNSNLANLVIDGVSLKINILSHKWAPEAIYPSRHRV